MYRKKIISLLVILALLGLWAAGCNSRPPNTEPQVPPPQGGEIMEEPETPPRKTEPEQGESRPQPDRPVESLLVPGEEPDHPVTPESPPPQGEAPADTEILYTYNVINTFPHDPAAFTQGLYYRDGYFFEGTGLYGRSSLRKVNMGDGRVLMQTDLPGEYFGEGIVEFEDRIVQLTWRENTGFVYDRETFQIIETFSYETEGWGITSDGNNLIMSDGSEWLTFLDPVTYQPVRRLEVTGANGPVDMLNELEYIEGSIYANIWLTDAIVIIDPASGKITGRINLEGLLEHSEQPPLKTDVLNGIAYDAENRRLFVTGKLWPGIFEIELVPVNN